MTLTANVEAYYVLPVFVCYIQENKINRQNIQSRKEREREYIAMHCKLLIKTIHQSPLYFFTKALETGLKHLHCFRRFFRFSCLHICQSLIFADL